MCCSVIVPSQAYHRTGTVVVVAKQPPVEDWFPFWCLRFWSPWSFTTMGDDLSSSLDTAHECRNAVWVFLNKSTLHWTAQCLQLQPLPHKAFSLQIFAHVIGCEKVSFLLHYTPLPKPVHACEDCHGLALWLPEWMLLGCHTILVLLLACYFSHPIQSLLWL